MITHTKQWGNSLALLIPVAVAKQLRLEPGTKLELSVSGDTLCVKAVQEPFPTLDELLAKATPENRHAEYDWGKPVGREAW